MAVSWAILDDEAAKALNHAPYVDVCFLLNKF